MHERMPPLDREALRNLCALVKNLGAGPSPGVPMAELIGVPTLLAGGVAMTVDFALARELGQELIVLQVPAPTEPASVPDPRLAVLTLREFEIARLVAAGLPNKQIARKLSLSLATIKSHVHHILAKTGLPNRAAVAAVVVGHSGSSAQSRPPVHSETSNMGIVHSPDDRFRHD